MNPSRTTIGASDLHIAPGTGLLARRTDSLLFVADADAEGADAIVDAFTTADDTDVIDTVTDATVATAFAVPAFTVLDWGARRSGHVHLVVLGALEVRTDEPSLPMLSGSGSASWVERRLRIGSAAVTVHAGATTRPSTDLQLGRVGADGFSVTLTAVGSEGVEAVEPPPSREPTPPRSSTSPSSASHAVREPPTAEGARGTVDPTGPVAVDRLAALRAAVRQDSEPVDHRDDGERGLDPMDGVDRPHEPPIAPPLPPPVDDEITLAPDDHGEPPNPESMPDRRDDVADDDRAPFVVAVRCPRGHVNPSHLGVCRICGDLLDATAAQETIRQPPLGLLELPTNELLPIDRALVLGRRPDLENARVTGRGRAIVVADDASISRTHLRIDVEDWSLTVTDCGSRSGTALVSRPGEEPQVLEPWVPYELPVGARLFLGGPTSVTTRPATPA